MGRWEEVSVEVKGLSKEVRVWLMRREAGSGRDGEEQIPKNDYKAKLS